MSTYTNIFGGSTLSASDTSFRAFTFATNTTLSWPDELSSSSDIAADIMDVTASVSSLTLRMPPANSVAKGYAVLINNVGSETFTVAGNTGTTIITVEAGEKWQIYVADNTTAAGTWRSVQFGAATSAASAGDLAGYGTKATGSLLSQSMPVEEFNTTYLAGEPDRASCLIWTGGTGTLELPVANTIGADWFVNVKNAGSGVMTIEPDTSTIDGAATLALNPGESTIVVNDGTNYQSIGYGRATDFSFTYLSIDVAGTGTYTLSAVQQNKTAYNFTGILTGNRTVIIPTTLQQYWLDNETTGAFTLTVKPSAGAGFVISQGARAIAYCDGTDLLQADTAGISTPISVADGGTGATTASAARTALGATSIGAAVFTAASEAAGRTAFGSGATGDTLFTAASASSARSTLGATATGDALFTAASAAAGLSTLLGAPLASPTFTGTPAAPTAAANTNTTQIATTAYVQTELADYLTTSSASATYLTISTAASTYAGLAGPAFTGNPTATTQSPGNNSTRIATTAFVTAAITAAAGGITALTGDVTASGTGSVAATIASSAVTTSKINDTAVTYAKMNSAAIATAAEYQSDTASKILTAGIAWDAAEVETLTYAASYTPDLNTFINGVMTLTGNLTLNNPTNAKPGQSGMIVLIQDATGSRTLSPGANWKFPSGTSEVLTTTGSATDILFYTVYTSSFIACSLVKGLA